MSEINKSNGGSSNDERVSSHSDDTLPGGDVAGLRALLSRWEAPAPTHALDERVMGAYRRETNSEEPAAEASARAAAIQFSQAQSEVVKMKECPTCHEAFADKFVFCPTDGTPLTEAAQASIAETMDDDATVESAAAIGAGAAAVGGGALVKRGEYHLTMIQDENVFSRLSKEVRNVAHESQLTYPEFKRDPAGYSKRFVAGYGTLVKRTFSQPNVALSTMAAILIVTTIAILIIALDNLGPRPADLELVRMVDSSEFITPIPDEQPTPDPKDKGVGESESKGRVGFNKGTGEGSKPKPEKAGGGGGGGYEMPEPPQKGRIPPPSNIPTSIPIDPPKKVNKLPDFVGGVDIDPALYKPSALPNFGDPNSSSTARSGGPGTGRGIGTNNGTGIGSGDGRGYGPGNGRNIGGGDPNDGGGGSGGSRGGNPNPPAPPKEIYSTGELTRRISIVSKPEPGYTEDARKNNIQGTVTLRVLFSSNGSVSNVIPLKRLPDGLTEKAIAAAKQIKFVPAEKDGRKVSTYGQVNYQFNIY